jgi:hypothetical protein
MPEDLSEEGFGGGHVAPRPEHEVHRHATINLQVSNRFSDFICIRAAA